MSTGRPHGFFCRAGHGFDCDQRGFWDAAAAQLARGRTLALPGEHRR